MMIIVNPGQSIQDAINGASSGDIVYVRNGIYKESIRINKPLQLLGQSKQDTIIDGGYLGTDTIVDGKCIPSTCTSPCLPLPYPRGLVELLANNIKFSNFKVQHSQGAGVRTADRITNNIEIENIHTYRTYRSGIQTHYSNNLKIRYNEIERANYVCLASQESFSLAMVNNFEVSHNYLHENGIRFDNTLPGNGGMYIKQGCQNGTVHHNFLQNCSRQSLYLDGWSSSNPSNYNIDIYKNIVTKTFSGQCNAFQIVNEQGGTSEKITIRENIAYKADIGFGTTCGGNQSTLHGNIIDLMVKDNIFYKNNNKGIYLSDCPIYSHANILDNISCNNAGNMVIDQDIPNGTCQSYNCDIISANHIAKDYISQEEFDLRYNTLKNEIFGTNFFCGDVIEDIDNDSKVGS